MLCALLLVAGLAGTITHAELTEEQKKQLFLKTREKMRTVPTPTPEESATPAVSPAALRLESLSSDFLQTISRLDAEIAAERERLL